MGCQDMNVQLSELFPERTLEAIKGIRRLLKYKLRLNLFLAEDKLRSTSDLSLSKEVKVWTVYPRVDQWVGGPMSDKIPLCNPGRQKTQVKPPGTAMQWGGSPSLKIYWKMS